MHIDGPCGTLDARYQPPEEPAGVQAVLCHPHPLYGGTMDDMVLDCLTTILPAAGVGVLRFNFRGVGASAGRFDGGAGEVADLAAAAGWLRSEHSGDALWVGGYSFGAWVAWQALHGGLAADRLLLVAPPMGRMTFAPGRVSVPVDVFIGDADDFADPVMIESWPGVALHRIAGADHFFSGRLATLAAELEGVVSPRPGASR